MAKESQFHCPCNVDVVRVKSYENSLFNSTILPVRRSVNKLNLVPKRKYSTPVRIDGEEGAYRRKYGTLDVIAAVVYYSRKTLATVLFLRILNLFLEL